MRTTHAFLAAVAAVACAPNAFAADPLTVELPEQAAARTAVVTVGDVGRVTGGDAAAREWVSKLDVAEFRPREQSLTVSPRSIEYRLRLAGVDPAAVRVTGAARTTVVMTRRTVTADEVFAAARAEVLRRLPPGRGASVELVTPIVAKLPEVPTGDSVAIAAHPHSRVGPGRVQMDVAISAGEEKLLSLAVLLEVRTAADPIPPIPPVPPVAAAGAVSPAGPAAPAAPGAFPLLPKPAASEVLVRPRQRVTMQVRLGGAVVTAVGEALQEGRLGQNVTVQNVDSKKLVSARVSGPGLVDVELGGGP
jgi:hypothetical protein